MARPAHGAAPRRVAEPQAGLTLTECKELVRDALLASGQPAGPKQVDAALDAAGPRLTAGEGALATLPAHLFAQAAPTALGEHLLLRALCLPAPATAAFGWRLRIMAGGSGRVHMRLGTDAAAWCAANRPSTFSYAERPSAFDPDTACFLSVDFHRRLRPGEAYPTPESYLDRSGKWCAPHRARAIHCSVARRRDALTPAAGSCRCRGRSTTRRGPPSLPRASPASWAPAPRRSRAAG